MELSCGISLSLRRAAIEAGSIQPTPASPFVLALFSLCGESQAPSAGVWYVFLLTYTHTHPQLQRNASYFWAPKVIQTSSLFLVLLLLDHCAFSVSPESLHVFDLLATTSSAAYLEGALVLSAVNKYIA